MAAAARPVHEVTAPRRRALILPMMLLILALLALLSSSFALYINAHSAAASAIQNRTQLRLAAESGIRRAALMLRENRHNSALWYDNPDLFHNQVVFSVLGDRAEIDVSEDIDQSSVTYRYSLVGDDPEDDVSAVRYGIIDEGSKLNINFATPEQLQRLCAQVLPADSDVAPLVQSLADWRDQDDRPGEFGAEGEYYLALETPYTIKNGMFETVEELLLVRGFSAQLLFGEDYNRNGILDPNEDDGEASFPLDDQDGVLLRGIYPYLTVWTRDLNRNDANVNRLDLNKADPQEIAEALADAGLDPAVADYIRDARAARATFTSPLALYGHSYGDPDAGGNEGLDASGDNGVDVGGDQPEAAAAAGRYSSPVQLEDLPVLCDLTTAISQPSQFGLININTAPRVVLNCLVNDTFTESDVEAILAARGQLDGELLATPAWPLMQQVVSAAALQSIYAQITTRGQQFYIESIGHADHLGMMVRLQAVIEMRGHVPQFMYYRDITELGRYPIRGTREGDEVVETRRR